MKHLFVSIFAIGLSISNLLAQTPVDVCAKTGRSEFQSRGYYFTAPTDFTICGLHVSDEESTAFQSVAIVKFTMGAPQFPPTNDFVVLYENLYHGPNTPVCFPTISINTGDIIGVYGSRDSSSINSHTSVNNCAIDINGLLTPVIRSGMSYGLVTSGGIHDVWGDPGYIPRITMYINCPYLDTIPFISGSNSICQGDIVAYDVPAQAGSASYNWIVPSGAEIIGTTDSNHLSMVWNTTTGGEICVNWSDGCPTSDLTCLDVTVNSAPEVTVPNDATYCSGDSVPAAVFITSPTDATVSWTNSNTTIGLAASGSGNIPDFSLANNSNASITSTISVIATVPNGCESQPASYAITVNPNFEVTSSGSINTGESANLNVIPNITGATYFWEPPTGLSCTFCQNPIATPSESTWYYITATSTLGCSLNDSIYVEVNSGKDIYVPNIFSPNGDGSNDRHVVSGNGIEGFNITIYNRWGQLIFESNDIADSWDGTKNGVLVNQGVYVYKVQAVMFDGEVVEEMGNVTLVR